MAFTLTQPLYGQGGSYTAQQDRLLINADVASQGVKKLTAASGGVMTGDLAVTTTGAANGSVSVASGDVFIRHTTSGQGMYYAFNDAATTVGSFAANASGNSRIDLVCVLVTDTGAAPSVAFSIVQGTPAASPVAPTPPASSTAHYLILAQVTIPNGFTVTTTVAAGNIVDVRTKAFVPDLSVQGTVSSTGTLATNVPSPSDGNLLYSSSGKHLIAYNAATTAFEQVAPTAGFRNAIINGGFDINQRAFTSTTTNLAYGQDRWRLVASDGTVTYTPQAFTPGNPIAGYEPTNYAQIVTTGQTLASAEAALIQPIEDVRSFAGQVVTVSFWAKATSGTPKVAVEFEQRFGSGGSPSATVQTYGGQVTLSTSWARYQTTFSVASISGKTIGTDANSSSVWAKLYVSAGSSLNARTGSLGIQTNTFQFWGVQVEAGAVASPFERRPIGTELALCQRYYMNRNSTIQLYFTCATVTSSFAYGTVYFPVQMRAAPNMTYTIQNASGFYVIAPSGSSDTYGFQWSSPQMNANQTVGYFSFTWIAEKEL